MLRKVILWILLSLNIVSALLFLGCCLSAYISPVTFPFLSIINLGFPLVLAGNGIWMIFWMLIKRKYVLISLIALLLGSFNLLNYCSFFPHKANLPEGSRAYTIMTYNVANFDLYNWAHNVDSKKSIMEVIQEQHPDILCLQEFYSDSSRQFNMLEELLKIYPYYHFRKSLSLDHGRYWGQATFSRFPILKKELLSFENAKHNLCLVSTINIDDSLLSLYNVHLQSYHFDPADYEVMEKIGINQATEKLPVRRWYNKLSNATQQRAHQADLLEEHIQNDPNKVILCGDFNDSPNSYVYHVVSKGLKDTFLKAGYGVGQTYNGPFPSLRIDYILVNPAIKVLEHKVIKQGASDHFAVWTRVGF